MDSAHFGQNLKNLAKYIIKSSVHKTDDLVPLKNDRIFFHKFVGKIIQFFVGIGLLIVFVLILFCKYFLEIESLRERKKANESYNTQFN